MTRKVNQEDIKVVMETEVETIMEIEEVIEATTMIKVEAAEADIISHREIMMVEVKKETKTCQTRNMMYLHNVST
jgi:hypothetical protein